MTTPTPLPLDCPYCGSRERNVLRARVAELENERDAALNNWKGAMASRDAARDERDEAAKRVAELEAHANALRDALEPFVPKEYIERGRCICGNPPEKCNVEHAIRALAAHPAASLAAHDAEVLERAATCAESYLWNLPAIQSQVGANCGDAIRALAAQAQEVK